MLDNLVGNAIKYADDGAIRISIEEGALPSATRAVRISVTDQGPGIAAHERDAVFTPFFRTPDAAQSAVPGLGLGLYISHELIREHGGTITMSETDAGGSRFSVTLPIPA